MRNAYVKKLLASLFLVAIFLGAFHHHDDGGVHEDCPIHILEASLVSGDIPLIALFEKIDIQYPVPSGSISIYVDTYKNSGYFGRAPPYFS